MPPPSHQKRADDALSARKMPKGNFGFAFTSMGLMILMMTIPPCQAGLKGWSRLSTIDEMKKKVLASLDDDIPLDQVCQCAQPFHALMIPFSLYL